MSRREIERATRLCMVYVQKPRRLVRYDWSITARQEESSQ